MQRNLFIAAAVIAAFVLTWLHGQHHGYTAAQSERAPVIESQRPGKALPGGGVLLPRVPGATGDLPKPKAPTKGATHIRGSEITVGGLKPEPRVTDREGSAAGGVSGSQSFPNGKTCPTAEDFQCPEVKLRLDLWEENDGSWGVTAFTDKGKVVGGIDLPDRQPSRESPRVWAAGLEYEAGSGDVALAVDRSFGLLEVGMAAEVKSEDPEVRARVLWRLK